MDEKAQERYRKEQIDMVYFIKKDHSRYPEIAEASSNGVIYHRSLPICSDGCPKFSEEYSNEKDCHRSLQIHPDGCPRFSESYSGEKDYYRNLALCVGLPGTEEFTAPGYIYARRIHKGIDYQAACEKFLSGK